MLSLEQGVIDGTTEEGREKLRELEEQVAREKEEGQEKAQVEEKEEEDIKTADPD